MKSNSTLYLSEEALRGNIAFLKQQLGEQVRLSSVIKGNAYGHGIEVFAPMVERCGVDHFCVFSADEAYKAKKVLSPDSTLLVMGAFYNDDAAWLIENDVEFFVFDLDRLNAALDAARALNKPAKIHIEVETAYHYRSQWALYFGASGGRYGHGQKS